MTMTEDTIVFFWYEHSRSRASRALDNSGIETFLKYLKFWFIYVS